MHNVHKSQSNRNGGPIVSPRVRLHQTQSQITSGRSCDGLWLEILIESKLLISSRSSPPESTLILFQSFLKAFQWQNPDHKRAGVDDMTLLPQIKDSAIVGNLKKRFDVDWIFTYIGPVLVSVNPFKPMKYFTQREVDMYQGAVSTQLKI